MGVFWKMIVPGISEDLCSSLKQYHSEVGTFYFCPKVENTQYQRLDFFTPNWEISLNL